MNIAFADVSNVTSIAKTGGLYLFYGSGELLYIGKAGDLRTRISQHLHGKANTVDVCKFFETVCVFYVDDAVSRDVLETILINEWKPKLNVDKVWSYTSSKWTFLESDPGYIESQREIRLAMDEVYAGINL